MVKRMTDINPVNDSALPKRSVRVSDELWETAMAKARSENFTLSQVVRKCLTDYIESPHA